MIRLDQSLEYSYFCYLGTHAKIFNPTITLSGRTVRAAERQKEEKKKERREKVNDYSGTIVCTLVGGPVSCRIGGVTGTLGGRSLV